MNLCYLAKFGKNKFNLWHMLLGAIAGGAHTVSQQNPSSAIAPVSTPEDVGAGSKYAAQASSHIVLEAAQQPPPLHELP